jgi:hypothetical protein
MAHISIAPKATIQFRHRMDFVVVQPGKRYQITAPSTFVSIPNILDESTRQITIVTTPGFVDTSMLLNNALTVDIVINIAVREILNFHI